jgi:hypothetical protein
VVAVGELRRGAARAGRPRVSGHPPGQRGAPGDGRSRPVAFTRGRDRRDILLSADVTKRRSTSCSPAPGSIHVDGRLSWLPCSAGGGRDTVFTPSACRDGFGVPSTCCARGRSGCQPRSPKINLLLAPTLVRRGKSPRRQTMRLSSGARVNTGRWHTAATRPACGARKVCTTSPACSRSLVAICTCATSLRYTSRMIGVASPSRCAWKATSARYSMRAPRRNTKSGWLKPAGNSKRQPRRGSRTGGARAA